MSPMSVLVTGGAGFLGGFIVEGIQEQHPDWTVASLDIHNAESPRPNVHYIIGSVTNHGQVQAAVRETKPSLIIHTAGQVPPLHSRYNRKMQKLVWKTNVDGTQIMLEVARAEGVKAFVWTSSVCCVTDDLTKQFPNVDESWPTCNKSLVYGESKAAAEALVLAANSPIFHTCSLRPSVIIGPGDTQFVPPVHACIAKHETPYIVGSGQNLWDLTYVSNVADAHILAAANLLSPNPTAAGLAFFISNNEPITFREMCLYIWAYFGHHPPFEVHVPESLATLMGYIAEYVAWATGGPFTLSSESVKDACITRYANGALAERLLGYTPRVGLEEGLRRGCEDYARRLAKMGAKGEMSRNVKAPEVFLK